MTSNPDTTAPATRPSAEEPSPRPRCLNCSAPLAGPYCGACGQKALADEDRRFHHLVGQFVEAVTELDGRFWGSVKALLFRPGVLSRDYIEGRRVRWMSPMALFLLANLLYFLAPALTDFSLPFDNQVPGELVVEVLEAEGETLSAEERATFLGWGGQLHSPVTASWVEARVERRDRERMARTDGQARYTMADYARAYDARMPEVSKLLIVLHVPFMALALLAVFRRRGFYFAEHFVVSLHLFAFYILFLELMSGLLSLLSRVFPGAGWLQGVWGMIGLATLGVVTGYTVMALRTAYVASMTRVVVGTAGVIFLLMAGHLVVYRTVQFLVVFLLT
jgi:hypothetical protein